MGVGPPLSVLVTASLMTGCTCSRRWRIRWLGVRCKPFHADTSWMQFAWGAVKTAETPHGAADD